MNAFSTPRPPDNYEIKRAESHLNVAIQTLNAYLEMLETSGDEPNQGVLDGLRLQIKRREKDLEKALGYLPMPKGFYPSIPASATPDFFESVNLD
jgi:hypothetical protein